MATHSSVLAWRIPGTGEPGGLPSMGSHRVGHDWSGLAAAAAVQWVSVRRRHARWLIFCLWPPGGASYNSEQRLGGFHEMVGVAVRSVPHSSPPSTIWHPKGKYLKQQNYYISSNSWQIFPGGSAVKSWPANTGDTVPSLVQEDPLENEMATCSSVLAWEIPWTEEPGGL